MAPNTTTRRRGLLAATVVAATVIGGALVAPTAASAATTTVTVPGATITRSDATAGTTLTVKATVARLDLWCSSGKLVVDKKATAIPCNRLLSVTTTGLTGNDTVVINATGFGSSLPKTTLVVKTGAGNDTVSVRHRGSLTVYAGTGNDKVEAGLASGSHPVSEVLSGEDGNDTLTNLGFITAPPVSYDWDAIAASKALGSMLRGGAGSDTLVGNGLRWTDVTIDPGDLVDLHDGPGLIAPDEGAGVAPSFTYQQAAGDPINPDTLAYGRATSLTVRCAIVTGQPRAQYVVNGRRLPVACADRYLTVQGTDRAEALDYDQVLGNGFDRYGMRLTANLGGGDDVATVKHPKGGVDLEGGAGNDRLSAGIHNAVGNGEANNNDTLGGGAGNDTLTNLGFLDPNPPTPVPGEPDFSYDYTTHLRGDAGTDQLLGAKVLRNWFDLDVNDTVVDPGSLSMYLVSGSTGADKVALHLRPNTMSELQLTVGGVYRSFPIPAASASIDLRALGGNDTISVDGASLRTNVVIDPGDGTDSLRLAPLVRGTLDAPSGDPTWLRQPGYAGIAYFASRTEQFNLLQPA